MIIQTSSLFRIPENVHIYICIDLKSYYASVECVYRGLDPLTTRLLVADPSRSDQTICLAVSPALKAIGVPARPRLFEAKQAIRRYEAQYHEKVTYITAVPRMAEYEKVSAQIYGLYLRHAAPEDIHVYSIDECFIDCTPYLHTYLANSTYARTLSDASSGGSCAPERSPFLVSPPPEGCMAAAQQMAMDMIHDVLAETGITATVGIGTNLYLAKVAMDIVAKKKPADKNGVRIAMLDETSYKYLLWGHRPLTDFWQIGPGKCRRLQNAGMFTMGDIAERTQWDEEFFYHTFGIDGEILIDHAWGIEPVTMQEIKQYHTSSTSLSNGQVLPRPYKYEEARTVFTEMIDLQCQELFSRNLTTCCLTWWVSYDYKSLEACPAYDGPVALDFYGRLHPKHSTGTVRFSRRTNSCQTISAALLSQFDAVTDHRLLFRRLGISANDTETDNGIYQMNLFTDYDALEKEQKIQGAMLALRKRFGKNAVFKGTSLLEGATGIERNSQIGGHRA